MNRTQKEQEVENLKSEFAASKVLLVAEYKGVKVNDLTVLRQKLSENGAKFKVIKNRLAKIAVSDSDMSVLQSSFKGAVAVCYSDVDPVSPAKVLSDFAKGNENLKVTAGYLGGKLISDNEVKALADMPSKEELIAKLMSSMQAPATNLVGVLSQLPRQVVQVLSAVKDKMA